MSVEVPAWLDEAVRRTDWFRRPPSRLGGPTGFKEWMHFCVYGPGFDLLVNFSEVDDAGETAGSHPPARVRQVILARTDRWIGSVDEIEPGRQAIRAGRIEARFGDSALSYADGRYRLVAHAPRIGVHIELDLVPIATPAPIHNVTVGDGPPIHWVVVPRLLASGTVRIGDFATEVEAVPAYHDHNWGHFRWGADFAWEWGFGLPRSADDPWSFVFARLSNRALHRTRMQTLFLWRERRQAAAFRDSQIAIHHEGLLRPDRVLKLPPVMGLLSRGVATDLPERMVLEARHARAELHAVFHLRDVAQVVLPNDDDHGVTIINEVAGDLDLRARVDGEDVHIACPTIFEFLGR